MTKKRATEKRNHPSGVKSGGERSRGVKRVFWVTPAQEPEGRNRMPLKEPAVGVKKAKLGANERWGEKKETGGRGGDEHKKNGCGVTGKKARAEKEQRRWSGLQESWKKK